MSRTTGAEQGCKCPACLASERREAGAGVPFRPEARGWRGPFHLALHASLPIVGALLIGRSWWAVVPFLGAVAAYLANSFILCPTCAYHHADVRSCGCYPKSVFPYRRYLGERWNGRANVIGRSSVMLLTIGPTIAVLLGRGDSRGTVIVAALAIVAVFLTSTIACPDCRQQDVCTLGQLTKAAIGRKDL
jgi:hypothetical protein